MIWSGKTQLKGPKEGEELCYACAWAPSANVSNGFFCLFVLVNVIWFSMFLGQVNFSMLKRADWISPCLTRKQISAYGAECHFEKNNTWEKNLYLGTIYVKNPV